MIVVLALIGGVTVVCVNGIVELIVCGGMGVFGAVSLKIMPFLAAIIFFKLPTP